MSNDENDEEQKEIGFYSKAALTYFQKETVLFIVLDNDNLMDIDEDKECVVTVDEEVMKVFSKAVNKRIIIKKKKGEYQLIK